MSVRFVECGNAFGLTCGAARPLSLLVNDSEAPETHACEPSPKVAPHATPVHHGLHLEKSSRGVVSS